MVPDDRGRPVELLPILTRMRDAARPETPDPALYDLLRRILVASRVNVYQRVGRLVIVMILAWALLVGVLVGIRLLVPIAPWVVGVLIGLAAPAVASVYALYRRRALAPQIVSTMLSEGRCPGCAYVLARQAPQADARVVCPECAAAWNHDRIGSPRADLGSLSPSEFSPGRQTWLRSLRGHDRVVTDAKGRITGLVHPRLYHISAEQRAALGPERIKQARQRIGPGFVIRLLRGVVVWTLYALIAWAMLAFAFRPHAGGFLLAMLGVFYVASSFVMFAFGAVLGWRLYTGASMVSSEVARDRLVAERICPHCAADLARVQPDSAGLLVCPSCTSAWSPPTSTPKA
jgi:ribosomal protein L37AE/L43A